jgi:hypothetical protein
MRHHYTGARRCAALAVLVLGLQATPAFVSSSQAQPGQPAGRAEESKAADPDLEKMRYELEKRRVDLETRRVDLETRRVTLEERRLKFEKGKASDARSDVWWTRGSIAVPILIGFLTLWWQARTAFQLKAFEVILGSKSTQAGKERANALHQLFPGYISDDFVKAFEGNLKLPGIAYQEKKLELFKALSGNYGKRREIFRAYAMLYADEKKVVTEFLDKWRSLYPEDGDWVDALTARWNEVFPKGNWENEDEKASPGQSPARP